MFDGLKGARRNIHGLFPVSSLRSRRNNQNERIVLRLRQTNIPAIRLRAQAVNFRVTGGLAAISKRHAVTREDSARILFTLPAELRLNPLSVLGTGVPIP
jgi:hypothetical protein